MNLPKPLTTYLLHRGALASNPESLRPDPSLFERIGGRPIVEKVTDEAPVCVKLGFLDRSSPILQEKIAVGEGTFSSYRRDPRSHGCV